MKLLALIPAFNEEANIRNVVEETMRHLPGADILVVNDCSTDGTMGVLRSIEDIHVLDLPFNMGIGAAVLSGFEFFIRSGYDVLVRLDGDGQHPPQQAPILVQPIVDGLHDVTIGSRYLDTEQVYSSFTRKLGIKFLNLMTAVILRKRITDSTSGFRAYNRKAIEYLARDYPFDYPEPEEVYLLARGGFRLAELQIVMKERERGVSSITMLRTYYYLVKVVVTIFVKYAIGGSRDGK